MQARRAATHRTQPTRGRVTQIALGRSAGQLRVIDGRRAFYHHTDVEGDQFELVVGDEVTCELIDDSVQRSPRGVNVRFARQRQIERAT